MSNRHQRSEYVSQRFISLALQAILLMVAVILLLRENVNADGIIQLLYAVLLLIAADTFLFHRVLHRQPERDHRRLQNSEQDCYRSLLDLLPQTVFELDRGGNFLYANRQGFQVSGYTQEDIAKGLNVFELLVPEEHERARRNLGQLLAKGGVQINSYIMQKKNGDRFPVQIHAAAIMYAQRILGVRGIAIDITEHQQVEEELLQHRLHLQELVNERTAEIVQVNEALQREVMKRLETQEALRASDERFRRAILDAPYPIMIHAEDGEVILLSRVWNELTGYSPKELPDMSAWTSKAYGEHVAKVRRGNQELYHLDRRVYEGEFEVRTANGKTRIWDFSSAPLGKLLDGRRAVISVGVDITGRKCVESMLREKESAIASSINAIAFATLEGNLTYINASFLRIWGYDHEEEVLGKSVLDFWQDPEKAAHLIEALHEEGSWFGELKAKRKDSSIGIFQLSANMIRNEQDHPISMMASFIDVTEYTRAERALKENEKRLNDALNMGRMGFWEYDIERQEIHWSEQMFRLYERDPALGPLDGKGEQEYYSPEQTAILLQHARKTIEEGGETHYDMNVRLAGNRLVQFASSIHAVKNDEGKVVRLFGIVQDITERKQAEEQLKTSLQEKEVLLKEVHHRVKNNLQIIGSMLYLQSRTIQDQEGRRVFLDMRNRIKSMALVHENLYQTENLARIDIAGYIRRLVVNIFRSYRGRSSGIVSTIEVDDIFLSTETAIPCGLIITELVSNALKYAFPERHGEVLVGMHQDADQHLILEVSDNGIGFPEDFEERRNSSLGINLVRSLVEQLDGAIDIHSGQGSLFRIKFREPTYRKRI